MVLEESKLLMYKYFYGPLQRLSNPQVLFSDTGKWIYAYLIVRFIYTQNRKSECS